MTQSLDTALYAKLTADTSATAVHGLTGGRIYNGRAPLGAALPMVTFSARATPDGTFSSDSSQAHVRVEVWADASGGVAAARAIDGAAHAQLDRQDLTAGGYGTAAACCVERGALEVEGNVLHVRSEYRVWLRR